MTNQAVVKSVALVACSKEVFAAVLEDLGTSVDPAAESDINAEVAPPGMPRTLTDDEREYGWT